MFNFIDRLRIDKWGVKFMANRKFLRIQKKIGTRTTVAVIAMVVILLVGSINPSEVVASRVQKQVSGLNILVYHNSTDSLHRIIMDLSGIILLPIMLLQL